MRLGFFGNSNNYPFMLAVALRRRGHDVLFIVDQQDPLYRPEFRYGGFGAASNWILDVSPVRFRHYAIPNPRIARVVRLLRGCDAVVLNQYGPSLLTAIDRPALTLLTGSDLEIYANLDTLRSFWSSLNTRWATPANLAFYWLLRSLVLKQRKGIQESGVIRFFPRGVTPVGDQLLDELGVTERVKFYLPMTDIDAIAPAPPPMNDPPRLLSVARLNWTKPMRKGATQLDYKGTDIMVRGIAKFVRETMKRVEIHMVRKGWDVAATEQLLIECGLQHLVVWHDEMSQSRLFDLVRVSDVVIEQLDQSLPGSGAVDALALGRPVIANWRRDVVPEYRRLPYEAICQASTDEEVCLQLKRVLLNRSETERICVASRRAVETHLSSDHAAAQCEVQLAALVGSRIS